jgi:hypothetical protein
MGRSIPSFRQLLEIEKLNWSLFKKLLPTKKDKQEFDMVFDNVKLYTSYLGNASNPIVAESVMMSAIFHNYKQLLYITKEGSKIDEDTLRGTLIYLIKNNPDGKILFYRYSKKWRGFIYSLHKEDRLILLKMLLEICSFNECVNKVINVKDSQSNIDSLFYLLALMLQQKRIDELYAPGSKKNVTLLDFMCK